MKWATGATVLLGFGAFLGGFSNTEAADATSERLDPAFARLVMEKRALAKRLGEQHEVAVPSLVWNFFDAAQKGDWQTASNRFYRIEAGTGRLGGGAWVPLAIWGPIHDTFGAYEQ